MTYPMEVVAYYGHTVLFVNHYLQRALQSMVRRTGRWYKVCLGKASLVCYCLDRASCEIPGHSGLGTHETEEADRMSVKTTFLSLFVIFVCLLIGLVFATNLVIRHQRESARLMHRVLPLLEEGMARELQTSQHKGRFYTQTTLVLAGLTTMLTIGGFWLLRRVNR